MGVLVGLLVGLSASPVTGTLVGALVALLAGVFGIAEKLPTGLGRTGAIRLTAFAVSCAVALLLGIFMRTHQVLSPSVKDLRAQLSEMEIKSEEEQKQMLRFLRFGLLPSNAQAVKKDDEAAASIIKSVQSTLYAESTSFCAGLRDLIATDAVAEDLLSYLRTGSDATKRIALSLGNLPKTEQLDALKKGPLFLCAP